MLPALRESRLDSGTAEIGPDGLRADRELGLPRVARSKRRAWTIAFDNNSEMTSLADFADVVIEDLERKVELRRHHGAALSNQWLATL